MHVNIWAITVPMCSAKGSSWSFCTLARLRATPVGRCWEETVQRLSISCSIPHQHARTHTTRVNKKNTGCTLLQFASIQTKQSERASACSVFSGHWPGQHSKHSAGQPLIFFSPHVSHSSSLLTAFWSWSLCSFWGKTRWWRRERGRAGETWALSCLFVPLLILFLLFSLLLFSLVVSFSSWNSAPPLALL